MYLLWRRYSRSGYAPPWFYALMAAGFVALMVWALVGHDWIVAAVALVMAPVTMAGSRVLRRASTRSAKDDSHLHRTEGPHG